jgi:hypothetical protein
MLQSGSWYIEQAKRRVRATVDARFDWPDTLNRAGLLLIRARRWTESLNDTWTLRAKRGEDFIPLPIELVRINGTIKTDSTGERVETIGLSDLRQLAQRNNLQTDVDNRVWKVALDGRRGDSPDVPARRGLAIWPVPAEDGTPTLYVSGRRGWRPFTEDNLEQRPCLCDHWHDAYFLAVNCVAKETKDPEEGEAPERRQLAETVEALWQDEEDAVDDMGPLRGAVDRMDDFEEIPVDWNASAQNP